MKVLIYRPNDGFLCEENGTSSPSFYKALSYSLTVCAAILENGGLHVAVLDACAEHLTWQRSIERIESHKPEALIVALNNFAAGLSLKGLEYIKDRMEIPIIALMTHSMEEETLKSYPFLYAGIRRAWGETALDLLDTISRGLDPSSVSGATLSIDGEIVKTGKRPHLALDQKPLPALHLFPMKRYDAYQIAMSEGCNYHCSFCWFRIHPPSGWCGRNHDRVLEELEMLKQYGNRPVFTIDDELTLDPDYAKALCRKIMGARLKMMFSANTRADRADEELFTLMSEAGFFNLQFGVESGSQKILDKNGTRKKLDQVKKTYAMLEKLNISTKVFFLIGMLHETRNTIEQTYRFATKELNHYDASFDIAIPYRETVMFKYLKKKGWIENLDTENLSWIYYHVYGCKQLSGVPMRKPFWRIGDMTFDDLYNLERRYYNRIPHGGVSAQMKRLAFNPNFRKTLAHFTIKNPLFTAQLASRSISLH